MESERTDDAAELERQIKGWRRAKRLALVEERLNDLPALSRSGSYEGGADDELRIRRGSTIPELVEGTW